MNYEVIAHMMKARGNLKVALIFAPSLLEHIIKSHLSQVILVPPVIFTFSRGGRLPILSSRLHELGF